MYKWEGKPSGRGRKGPNPNPRYSNARPVSSGERANDRLQDFPAVRPHFHVDLRIRARLAEVHRGNGNAGIAAVIFLIFGAARRATMSVAPAWSSVIPVLAGYHTYASFR